MKVGFILDSEAGENLASKLSAIHDVTVWAEGEHRLRSSTLRRCGSSAEVCSGVEILFVSLSTSEAFRRSVLATGGAVDLLGEGAVVVQQMTDDPGETKRAADLLALKKVLLVSAPRTDGDYSSPEREVVLLVSGPTAAMSKLAQCFDGLNLSWQHCSENAHDAQALALVNTTMTANSRMATLEIIAMGRKMGLSLETMSDVMNKGTGVNVTTKTVFPRMLSGTSFLDSQTISDVIADLTLATNVGEKIGLPMLVTNASRSVHVLAENLLGPGVSLGDLVGAVEVMARTELQPDRDPS